MRHKASGLLAIGYLVVSVCFIATAHPGGNSYLRLDFDAISPVGAWEVPLPDLALALSLDADSNGAITRIEVTRRQADISRYLLRTLTVRRGGHVCHPSSGELGIVRRDLDAIVVVPLGYRCAGNRGLVQIDYRLLFDLDPTHRGLATVLVAGREHTAVFSPRTRYLIIP